VKYRVDLWRNRQARRAELLGHDKEKFYSFLRERGYTWINKVEVNGILHQHSTIKQKTGPQVRAIQDYRDYLKNPRPVKNQQVAEDIAPMQGGYVPV
jgi:hypothetical protein